jgi:multidrug efflux pump
MTGVTLFGLLLTPVFYVAVQGLVQRLSSSKRKTGPAPADQSSSGLDS